MGLAAFLFSGDVRIAAKVSKTPSRGKNFRKKSFLKFSIRLWVWFFETPDEEFPTRFSKLHFSCPEGNLKKKQFLFKTFPQELCDFEQSNFWTFNENFFRQFCRHYIFCVQSNFSRESFYDQLNHRSKTYVNKKINKFRKWKRISQTSGKTYRKSGQNCNLNSPAEKLSGNCSWKNSFFHCFPNFALKIFRLSPTSFSRVVKTAF